VRRARSLEWPPRATESATATRPTRSPATSLRPPAHTSRSLRDDLKLGTGETQYHLRTLRDEGVIESRRDGDYRRFFPAGRFDEFQQVALGTLRRETPRKMLIALLEGDRSPTEIADRLSVSRPTVSKHATTLEQAGLLRRQPEYAVVEPETVLVLLVRYADSFGEDAARLADRAPNLFDYDA